MSLNPMDLSFDDSTCVTCGAKLPEAPDENSYAFQGYCNSTCFGQDSDEQDYLAATTCPCCGGEGAWIGTLGSTAHFRCIDCGIDYSDSGYVSQGSTDADLVVADDDS